MSNRRKGIDKCNQNQLSLFDMLEKINPQKFSEPDYQIENKSLSLRIKDALSEAMKNSGLKRYAIAGQMSEFLGVEITESMLNCYTAESKEGYRMPAEYIPVFCKITQNYKVLEILACSAGGKFAKSDDIYFMEIGMRRQVVKTATKEIAEIEAEWRRSRGEPI